MRFTLPLSLAGLAATLAFALAGAAYAHQAVRPDQPVPVSALRSFVDHYRMLTWRYERAAHLKRTPTSFSYRKSTNPSYLQRSIDTWTGRAYAARRAALSALDRRLALHLPAPPTLHARLEARIGYSRRLTLRLRRIYPGRVSRRFASAAARTAAANLRLWQARSALAAVSVAEHAGPAAIPGGLRDAFLCIHHYEGAWNSNTGNGYYGGLQMDRAFQGLYGADYVRRWGTADNWPAWAQLQAAVRAYQSGRGFGPWPNTARDCGLL